MTPDLCTKRLRLESFSARHAQELLAYEIRNREHLQPWEPERPNHYNVLKQIQQQIEACIMQTIEGKMQRFAVFADGSEIVAIVNLWNIERGVSQSAILGYSVDAVYQGRGFATEAAAAVVRFAFDDLNLHRIHTSPENAGSARVLQKLGFQIEGRARHNLFINGAWRDGILVALLNDNWQHRP